MLYISANERKNKGDTTVTMAVQTTTNKAEKRAGKVDSCAPCFFLLHAYNGFSQMTCAKHTGERGGKGRHDGTSYE